MIHLLSKPSPPPDYSSYLPPITPVPSTPVFTISLKTVSDRLSSLHLALNRYHFKYKIAFSFKTNYDFAHSSYLLKNNLLAETVSSYEYDMAIKLGFRPKNIILNGPYKSNLSSAIHQPCTIHLDNFPELTKAITQKDIRSTIGIRLNSTTLPSRFGFNIESGDAKKAITTLAKRHLPLHSIHIHLGSDIYDPQLYQKAALLFGKFVASNHLNDLKTVDFGGGFPAHGKSPYGRKPQICPDINMYAQAISLFYEQISYSPLLILEPGRYLIDDATTFVTKIINQRLIDGTQIITTDSTINMLPSLWYRPPTLVATNPGFLPLKTNPVNTIVYGSSCQEHDILFRGQLPTASIGSYLIFYIVGAYNQSQTGDFIFPKSPTYIS